VVLAIRGEEVPEVDSLGAGSGKQVVTLLPCSGQLSQVGFAVFPIPQNFNLLDPRDCCRVGRIFAEALRNVTGPQVS
jgi:hypothetical protein